MTDRDRAAVIAGIIISALAESVRSNAELRCRIAERLRDELADMRQELIAEFVSPRRIPHHHSPQHRA